MSEQAQTPPYHSVINKLPKAKVHITARIPASEFDGRRSEALRRIKAQTEFPGFRKGHVPEKIILAKLGEEVLLEEMAEIAIAHAYPLIVAAHKLDVLGRPSIRITSIAHGKPLEFTVECAVFPEFSLPDYTAIAQKIVRKEENPIVVTDEEMEKVITELRAIRKTQSTADVDGAAPSLDDAFVKTLGDFASVDDFKTQLRERLRKEKERQAKDRRRMEIIEAILNETTIDLPDIIVEEELRRLDAAFVDDIERMGLSMEQYLETIKKSRQEVLSEMRPDAEKRAKIQLIISRIAEVEKIEPDAEQLAAEVRAIREQYPDIPEERIESSVRLLATNQRVLEFLESR